MRLQENDPQVQRIVQQMYGLQEQVGKISSFVGYANMKQLQEELYELGWIARLKEDQQTIYLEQVK